MMNWGSGGAGGAGGGAGGAGGGAGGGFGRADGGGGGLPFRRVRSELNLDQITALGGGGGVGIGAGLGVVAFSAHHHQHHQHHLAAAHGRVPAAGMAAAAHVQASSSSASAMDASSPLGGGWRNDASDVLLPDVRVKQEPPMWVPVGAGGALQRAGTSSGGGGGHRRSASDSYNFVDDAFADEFGDAPGPSHAQVGVGMGSMGVGVGVGQLPSSSRMGMPGGDPHYDKLDDEQLLSMFMDVDTLDSIALPTETPNRAALGVPPGSSGQQQQQRPLKTAAARRPVLPPNGIAANAVPIPSCPEENLSDGSDGSDPNSTSEEGSLARMYASDPALLAVATSSGKAQDPNLLDPKRAKRILANRQSAQRSRMRKLQYISELEKRVAALQNDVANIAPQVQYLTNKRMGLDAENQELKARLTQIAQATRYKDALNEALRDDLQRLKANYGRMAAAGQLPASAPAGSEFINSSPARQQTAMEMAQAS